MPRYKYRAIQRPHAVSNITPEEAVELARATAAIIAARREPSRKSNGRVPSKTNAKSKLTHSPGTSSGAVGKNKKSTSKSKSKRKSVAFKR
jgi:hypothetical protein